MHLNELPQNLVLGRARLGLCRRAGAVNHTRKTSETTRAKAISRAWWFSALLRNGRFLGEVFKACLVPLHFALCLFGLSKLHICRERQRQKAGRSVEMGGTPAEAVGGGPGPEHRSQSRPRGEFQLRMSVKSDFQAWVCLDVYENKMLVALKPLERGGRARGQKCCQHCLLRRSQRNRLHWALSSEGCARKNRAWYPGTRDAWASDASPGPRRFQCEHTCLSKHVCRVCAQIRGMKIWKSHN